MDYKKAKMSEKVIFRFISKSLDIPPDYKGDPETHGFDSPRGGGFSIMQNLQKDLHEESYEESGVKPPKTGSELPTFIELQNRYASDGKHHCLRMTCASCGKVETCRCGEDKVSEVGICYDCNEKMSSVKLLKASIRQAMYWCKPGRTYRLTKGEQDGGHASCPKCKGMMERESFTKSEKLWRCPDCGFKVPTGKVTTTKIDLEVDTNGDVEVEITTASMNPRRVR